MDLIVCGSNSHNQLTLGTRSPEPDDIYQFMHVLSGQKVRVLFSEWCHNVGKRRDSERITYL